jgi:regulation of enolase protein 1 (concanavalin A-like superfamily)
MSSFASTILASTVTASWNPNTESDIAGYRLSYGVLSGVYTTTIDVGNVTSYGFSVLGGVKYYFVLQAIDTTGLLSPYSAELAFTVPLPLPPSLTSLSPSSGAVGSPVTIAGLNFGSTKDTVTFNGVSASATNWSTASIVVAVPAGATTGSVVVTVAGIASNAMPFTVTGGGGGSGSGGGPAPLPSPWQAQDVGSVSSTGSSSYSNGVFTIMGTGSDIWGTADGFQFAYQTLSGDGQIVANVSSLQNTSGNAKAGVMFRSSVAANSAHVILDVNPTGNVEFMSRGTTGGATTWIAGASDPAPVWLKLARSGSTLTGYVSADGSAWTTVGSTTVGLGAAVDVGLVVSSHTSQLNTSTFDQVAVSASAGVLPGLPGPWQAQDVGSVGQSGSSSYSSGVFTVKGAGSDIWGTADAFQFAHQSVNGDGQIVARLASLQNTSANAKAGVMFRGSVAANSAHVILDVNPNGNIEFMSRNSTGGATAWIAGAADPAPVWLKLVRSGSTVTGFVSADGGTWTTVGSTTINLGTVAETGLVVSSHTTAQLNTSTFDQVAVSSGAAAGGGLPSAWQAQDVGSVGVTGSTSYSSGVFTVKGAGADIWGTADAFQFAYQSVGSNGQIVVRVSSVQNTSANAKAGVMFRRSLAADSDFVMLDVAPNGNVEFMTRGTAGGATAWIGGTNHAAPVWLKLARSGSTVTGFVSSDGIIWTAVGSAPVGFVTSANVGLVVSSHTTGQLNTSTFDQVVVN